mmetsp:Transcript_39231/g.84446  ORF Transcript_39231/g.84446 Transcript_39231/m.84446 type:complete len:186 (+) Transcript_39231:90-647(+)
MSRSSGELAIPPSVYSSPKGKFWKGVHELERYPPVVDENIFDEYLNGKSVAPSRHQISLKSSRGLLELHYDSMRKKAQERAKCSTQLESPSMGRAYSACAGYSGNIPGKLSGNIVGCSFMEGSRLAKETFGSKLPRPMSGVTFTFPSERRNSSESFTKQRSNSLTCLPGVQSRSSLSQAGMALSS